MKKQDKTTTRLKLDYILQNAGWGILRLEQGDKIITSSSCFYGRTR